MYGMVISMKWNVLLFDEFVTEFTAFPRDVQTAMLAKARMLEHFAKERGLTW
jgi:hypothetical protein